MFNLLRSVPFPRTIITEARMWSHLILVISVSLRIEKLVDAALPSLALPKASSLPSLNVTDKRNGTVEAPLRYVHQIRCEIVEWKPTCST